MHKLEMSNFYLIKSVMMMCLLIAKANASEYVITTDFSPQVTANCKAGLMNIKVYFNNPYSGAVHARGFRNSKCMAYGNGSNTTALSLDLLVHPSSPDYCGILVNDRTEEQRSVQLVIRLHRTLELADDKFYIITCGRAGEYRDTNSRVMLQLMENEQRVREAIYGHEYTLKTRITTTNGTSDIAVRNCFAFDQKNTSIPLIDFRGCPTNSQLISKFKAETGAASASAVLKSMFKFPEGSAVHFQCDVILCTESCIDEYDCNNISEEEPNTAFMLKSSIRIPKDVIEEKLLAETTVFVVDPSNETLAFHGCEQTVRPSWLLWLAITLGVLFLIMLLMNVFLCTAMSCSCARTEIIEKEPSIIEDYDAYRSWHGSQYGSRYSLHDRNGQNKGYASGGSTIPSNRSDRY